MRKTALLRPSAAPVFASPLLASGELTLEATVQALAACGDAAPGPIGIFP
ncbi:MAG: hypothetical protein HZA93_29915 [Verrucomicrobia bacterium]|nr:hypothetical protein [Verrucomicrobiota bacterium]